MSKREVSTKYSVPSRSAIIASQEKALEQLFESQAKPPFFIMNIIFI